jgi:hypothetical protein
MTASFFAALVVYGVALLAILALAAISWVERFRRDEPYPHEISDGDD